MIIDKVGLCSQLVDKIIFISKLKNLPSTFETSHATVIRAILKISWLQENPGKCKKNDFSRCRLI